MNTIAITCGDVNGIGPEIVIKTLNKIYSVHKHKIFFICPDNIFDNSSQIIKPEFPYKKINKEKEILDSKKVIILNLPKVEQKYGKVTATSGKTAYTSIMKACSLAESKIVDGIVTSPISKEAFKKAKINFPGHTELLANYFNTKNFAMMFVSNKMKAALATIHIPLKQVARKITSNRLKNITDVIIESLQNDFRIANPKIAILGLNPHAGENGNIGKEEINIINNFISYYGKNVFGSFVPDAYFGNRIYKNFDCTIGMYHDQVLIPFKLLNFNRGVNYTAGLPIVRTSPDHGTAFDIAGKGIAKPGSMIEAFKLAEKIIINRKKHK
jgi:4-hydroxythreonine-4-phosphate dehydrogenase